MTPIPMQVKKTKGTREKHGKAMCVCVERDGDAAECCLLVVW